VAFGILVAIIWLFNHADSNGPHGNPDPGGKRLAYLERTAHAAVPADASVVSTKIHPYRWDPGGCDGGAAGWARAEIDLQFRPGTTREIDRAITSAHWRSVPVEGGTARREYQPAGHNRYDGYGWLFSSPGTHGTIWELDLSAGPAEVPTHSC
jgi:hypothetical protein